MRGAVDDRAGKALEVKAHPLPPYQMHEECGKLLAGDRLEYVWQAQAPLNFNIHYHEGKAVIMPVTRDGVKGESAEFKPLVTQDYCLMWEAGAQGTLLDYRVRLIRDREVSALSRDAGVHHRARQVPLLDLDGTLSDNFEGIAGSIRHALVCLGAPDPGDAVLRGCVGPPLRESFSRLIENACMDTVEQAIDAYRERYACAAGRKTSPIPACTTLRALAAAGVRLFVCTSKPEVFATRIVAHLGFHGVERVYGADLAGKLDDKSNLLAHVIRSERLDPALCIMVGDRHHDVRAARANGVRAGGVGLRLARGARWRTSAAECARRARDAHRSGRLASGLKRSEMRDATHRARCFVPVPAGARSVHCVPLRGACPNRIPMQR